MFHIVRGYQVALEQLNWRKSARSNDQGLCVEFAEVDNGNIALRDSKNPAGPVLTFTLDEWRAFAGGVKDGEFDL